MIKKNGKYVFNSDLSTVKEISNNITISTVTTLNEFKKFFQVPSIVYQDDEYWVPPFWFEARDFFSKKNPFWAHAEIRLFIVRKNKSAVGRIAAIIDHKYCGSIGEKIGFFGFFECINDFNYAQALLQSAQDWLEVKGMSKMRGPIDGRVDVGCGFLYSGFDSSPSLLSLYSPKYYLSFAEKFQMKKARDMISYYIDLTKPIPSQLEKRAQQSAQSGIKIRAFNRVRTKKELRWWVDLFLETFIDHWGYVPVPHKEVRSRFGVKQLRWFIDSKLFLVAEHNGLPVAFIWSTPDYNQVFQRMQGRLGPVQLLQFIILKNRIATGKLHVIGIKKEFRNQHIGSFLNYASLIEMKKRKYVGAEVGWIDEENNIAHTTIAITGAKLYKKNRVFEKNIKND